MDSFENPHTEKKIHCTIDSFALDDFLINKVGRSKIKQHQLFSSIRQYLEFANIAILSVHI